MNRSRHGIYCASRATIAGRVAMWRQLRAAGLPIISTWIDHAGSGAPDYSGIWNKALSEILDAERLILYVEPGDLPLAGVYVEVGAALGAHVPVFVVAPHVPDSVLGSWLTHRLVTRCATIEEAARCAVPKAAGREP